MIWLTHDAFEFALKTSKCMHPYFSRSCERPKSQMENLAAPSIMWIRRLPFRVWTKKKNITKVPPRLLRDTSAALPPRVAAFPAFACSQHYDQRHLLPAAINEGVSQRERWHRHYDDVRTLRAQRGACSSWTLLSFDAQNNTRVGLGTDVLND